MKKNKLKSFMDKQVQDDAPDPISTLFCLHEYLWMHFFTFISFG